MTWTLQTFHVDVKRCHVTKALTRLDKLPPFAMYIVHLNPSLYIKQSLHLYLAPRNIGAC